MKVAGWVLLILVLPGLVLPGVLQLCLCDGLGLACCVQAACCDGDAGMYPASDACCSAGPACCADADTRHGSDPCDDAGSRHGSEPCDDCGGKGTPGPVLCSDRSCDGCVAVTVEDHDLRVPAPSDDVHCAPVIPTPCAVVALIPAFPARFATDLRVLPVTRGDPDAPLQLRI